MVAELRWVLSDFDHTCSPFTDLIVKPVYFFLSVCLITKKEVEEI